VALITNLKVVGVFNSFIIIASLRVCLFCSLNLEVVAPL
jgi:hypothetical protein